LLVKDEPIEDVDENIMACKKSLERDAEHDVLASTGYLKMEGGVNLYTLSNQLFCVSDAAETCKKETVDINFMDCNLDASNQMSICKTEMDEDEVDKLLLPYRVRIDKTSLSSLEIIKCLNCRVSIDPLQQYSSLYFMDNNNRSCTLSKTQLKTCCDKCGKCHSTFLCRPHICDVCGDAFTRKSHLNIHKLIHTGERPHECDMCKAAFFLRKVI
jgi:hypothetical protein